MPTDHARLAGMSDDAVEAKTGRTWKQWTEVLDRAKAHTWAHRDIAKHVHETHKLSGWWSQTVTVGYERIKGLREIGQRRGGTYDVNKSRTVAVPVPKLYRAFSDARTRAKWLPDTPLTVRTAKANESLRITWNDGSAVEVSFTSKGKDKSQIRLQHRKLPNRKAAGAMRTFWSDRLDNLAMLLTK